MKITPFHNPALTEESRNEPVKVVPIIPRETLLGWLERTGRFLSSERDEFQDGQITEDLDDLLEPDIDILEEEEEQQDL
jgi:Protein of unknown function (DUF3134)